ATTRPVRCPSTAQSTPHSPARPPPPPPPPPKGPSPADRPRLHRPQQPPVRFPPPTNDHHPTRDKEDRSAHPTDRMGALTDNTEKSSTGSALWLQSPRGQPGSRRWRCRLRRR